MNKEVKTKWVAALRSGDFKQGRLQLKSEEGHCCLGVLCELAIKDGIIDDYFEDWWFPQKEVLSWAGLTSENPNVLLDNKEGQKEEFGIIIANDGKQSLGIKQHSFEEIADLIEKYL